VPKTISIHGRCYVVGGDENDDYYRNIPDGDDLTDPVLQAIAPLVARDAVCIDAGANIGLYTLAMSSLAPQGRVLAFEPSPATAGHLQENVRRNGATNVDVCPVALADRTGTVQFHDISFFSAGSFAADDASILTSDSYGSTVRETPVTTLDAVVAERGLERVDLVKIDVEGAELSVLAGAAATLAAHRPTVVLEFNSFAFAMHQSVLPQVALAEIARTFPFVYVIDREDGSLARVETASERYDLLYENGIHGPSDNLVCTFAGLDVDRRYTRADRTPPVGPTEAEALRATLSWRITEPLRWGKAQLSRLLPGRPQGA
jgi:FkbM family methyltransferase